MWPILCLYRRRYPSIGSAILAWRTTPGITEMPGPEPESITLTASNCIAYGERWQTPTACASFANDLGKSARRSMGAIARPDAPEGIRWAVMAQRAGIAK